MLGNSSGFYAYAIYEHLKEWPPFNLPQTRIVFKLRKDKFQYMAVGDNRQRHMPLPDDRVPPRGKELAFPEAVLLVNPVEPEFKGEVDDKYEYSCENRDLKVHGWICKKPGIGFWQITPSNEFRSGGPLKQNLTSHVGPITLAMFLSAHYAGEDMVLKFQSNEPWKKVFGPVFIYLNSLPNGTDTLHLWDDAKIQMMIEVQNWPYNFIASEDFPSSDQRGCLSGRLKVRDRYISEEDIVCGEEAHIGLAPPGCDIDMGEIVYEPPRDGPTLWEIGIPNRSAAEFYVPDPNPNYVNPLYLNHPDRFRQYGLWERYAELYPDGDLIYTIGVNDYTKDWFFAHVTRKTENDTYEGTTWQIKFDLDNKIETANATFQLRIALATANAAQLEVRINDENGNAPLFNSGQIGHDNAIARHGIHGVYRLFNISIPGSLLVNGKTNTIFLTQANNTSPLQGFMDICTPTDSVTTFGPSSYRMQCLRMRNARKMLDRALNAILSIFLSQIVPSGLSLSFFHLLNIITPVRRFDLGKMEAKIQKLEANHAPFIISPTSPTILDGTRRSFKRINRAFWFFLFKECLMHQTLHPHLFFASMVELFPFFSNLTMDDFLTNVLNSLALTTEENTVYTYDVGSTESHVAISLLLSGLNLASSMINPQAIQFPSLFHNRMHAENQLNVPPSSNEVMIPTPVNPNTQNLLPSAGNTGSVTNRSSPVYVSYPKNSVIIADQSSKTISGGILYTQSVADVALESAQEMILRGSSISGTIVDHQVGQPDSSVRGKGLDFASGVKRASFQSHQASLGGSLRSMLKQAHANDRDDGPYFASLSLE
uniref:Rhamnogalacturonan lyase domain-containing protein n=1 Tax=Cannabis sativa TaxID=3483 RepID=A0A803NLI2_CANSA